LDYNNENIGYLLNKAARSMRWHLNKRLEDYGLTAAQWAVLKDLHINENFGHVQNATPAAIAERLNMDRPTMSGITTRLYKNTWIETMSNPEDRRSQLIKLTDKSRKILEELEEVSDKIVIEALKDFSEQEVENIKILLSKIINNLK